MAGPSPAGLRCTPWGWRQIRPSGSACTKTRGADVEALPGRDLVDPWATNEWDLSIEK